MAQLLLPVGRLAPDRKATEATDLTFEFGDAVCLLGWLVRVDAEMSTNEAVEMPAVRRRVIPGLDL